MKLYIKSDILLDPELQSVMDEYNTRSNRYDERMKAWDSHNKEWRMMYDAWLEERKSNPDAPRPKQDVMVAPWCDPEYSMDEARHNVTIKTLDYVAGTNMWVKVNRNYWVKVLSRTKNPRKYIYYTCQLWCECVLGTGSFEVVKYRDDNIKVDIPIQILTENEFCKFVAKRFDPVISDPAQIEYAIYEELDNYNYNGNKLKP